MAFALVLSVLAILAASTATAESRLLAMSTTGVDDGATATTSPAAAGAAYDFTAEAGTAAARTTFLGAAAWAV